MNAEREGDLEKQIVALIQTEIRTLQADQTANRNDLVSLRVESAARIAEIRTAYERANEDFRQLKDGQQRIITAVVTSLLAIVTSVITAFLAYLNRRP